jgi:hypothetical protein
MVRHGCFLIISYLIGKYITCEELNLDNGLDSWSDNIWNSHVFI